MRNPTAAPSSVWTALEQFLNTLSAGQQLKQHQTDTLQAARAAARADAVAWVPDAAAEPLEAVGTVALDGDGWRELVRDAGAGEPAGRLLWAGAPGAAALLRTADPQPAWLVALRPAGPGFTPDDLDCLGLVWRIGWQHRRYHRSHAKVRDSLVGLIHCLSTALDAKDPFTSGHSERVARIAVKVGREMGLPGKDTSDLFLAGLLHDIGKIGVRDEVLLKPGPLTPDEAKHMQEHVLIGDRILQGIPVFHHLRKAVRSHHEHYDGTGYPDQLAGERIPLLARVIAVADACDAMMAARRYRPPLTPPQIDATFQELAGAQWDPHVVLAFMRVRHQVYPPIYQQGIGESAYHAVADVLTSGTARAYPAVAPGTIPES
jgi:putative nucleotidyltransferase with HDIG domain